MHTNGQFCMLKVKKSTIVVTLLQTGNSFAMQWGIILPYFMANASRKNVVPMLTVQLESIASHYRATRVQQWHSQRFDEKFKSVVFLMPYPYSLFCAYIRPGIDSMLNHIINLLSNLISA